MTIADAVDIPLIVYNIPGRTGKNIENPTMLKLAQHPNIIGVKEASGSISQVMELIAKMPKSFTVLSGERQPRPSDRGPRRKGSHLGGEQCHPPNKWRR